MLVRLGLVLWGLNTHPYLSGPDKGPTDGQGFRPALDRGRFNRVLASQRLGSWASSDQTSPPCSRGVLLGYSHQRLDQGVAGGEAARLCGVAPSLVILSGGQTAGGKVCEDVSVERIELMSLQQQAAPAFDLATIAQDPAQAPEIFGLPRL